MSLPIDCVLLYNAPLGLNPLEHVLQGSLDGIVGDLIGVEGALGEAEVHVSHPEHVARDGREKILKNQTNF